jgi:hypothetical protein
VFLSVTNTEDEALGTQEYNDKSRSLMKEGALKAN